MIRISVVAALASVVLSCGVEDDKLHTYAVGEVNVDPSLVNDLTPYSSLRLMLLDRSLVPGMTEAAEYSRDGAGMVLPFSADTHTPPFAYSFGDGTPGCDNSSHWRVLAWLLALQDEEVLVAGDAFFEPSRDPYGFIDFESPESYGNCHGGRVDGVNLTINTLD